MADKKELKWHDPFDWIYRFYRWWYRKLPEEERNSKAQWETDLFVISFIMVLVLFTIIVVFIYLFQLARFFHDSYFQGFRNAFGDFWFTTILSLLVGVVGIVLYKLRQKFRIFYGLVEMGFSLVYGWYSIAKAINQDASTGDALAVLAVLYLMVRGADNFAIGWKERRERDIIKFTEYQTSTGEKVKVAVYMDD